MSKQTGLGDNLYVAGYELSGDIGSLSRIGGGPAATDVTGIDKSAIERLGAIRDGSIEFSAFFNPAVGRAHPRFAALPTVDVLVSYFRGTALGGPSANLIGKQINYDPTRNADGSLAATVQAVANSYGLEWGISGTAGVRTDTSATNGTSLDNGAATAFGLQAYLHVFGVTGTSVTVKIQSSSDNGVGDAWSDVTGGAFSAATGITSQRIATGTLAIERYLRVVTTGTFTSGIFAVSIVRNDTAVAF